jgi:hypothetical protein
VCYLIGESKKVCTMHDDDGCCAVCTSISCARTADMRRVAGGVTECDLNGKIRLN